MAPKTRQILCEAGDIGYFWESILLKPTMWPHISVGKPNKGVVHPKMVIYPS